MYFVNLTSYLVYIPQCFTKILIFLLLGNYLFVTYKYKFLYKLSILIIIINIFN